MLRAVAVIDGEHYPPVVRDALAELPYEFVAAWLAGGAEKLRGADDYGVPLAADLEGAVTEYAPDVVVDLSDEPVVGPRERLRLASRVLALRVPYVGADFRLDPPPAAPVDVPSLAILGTGKRVGKTAVTGHAARVLADDRALVVVAMGRGGPAEPEVVSEQPSVEDLLARSRRGHHAASDYLETAAIAGVTTVGCRRCGGGFAGAPGTSNVAAGVELALGRRPDLLLLDASGASLPPIDVDARVVVIPANQPPELAAGYLNAFRILISDLVVLTFCEPDSGYEAVREAVVSVTPLPAVATVLRPRPMQPIDGRDVAFFTAAPASAHSMLADHLRDEHGAASVSVVGGLADRTALAEELERIEADVYLVELKAAAVDVVAERGFERGADVVLAGSDVLPLPGEADLDGHLRALADAAALEPTLP